ncbi:protein-cysteine N-palmitoyltransferase HHAT-like protein isoform X6 [Pseudorca crassidens]|uniref:protein-cysteine N-palmitoyltransferase HHAT-like protein isoform X6 n=1 Tax=Pseudorca crassidens TaxID=82174 RepID=UPI00352EBAF4
MATPSAPPQSSLQLPVASSSAALSSAPLRAAPLQKGHLLPALLLPHPSCCHHSPFTASRAWGPQSWTTAPGPQSPAGRTVARSDAGPQSPEVGSVPGSLTASSSPTQAMGVKTALPAAELGLYSLVLSGALGYAGRGLFEASQGGAHRKAFRESVRPGWEYIGRKMETNRDGLPQGLQHHPPQEQRSNGGMSGNVLDRGGARSSRAAHVVPLIPLYLPSWYFPQRGRQGPQPLLSSNAQEDSGGREGVETLSSPSASPLCPRPTLTCLGPPQDVADFEWVMWFTSFRNAIFLALSGHVLFAKLCTMVAPQLRSWMYAVYGALAVVGTMGPWYLLLLLGHCVGLYVVSLLHQPWLCLGLGLASLASFKLDPLISWQRCCFTGAVVSRCCVVPALRWRAVPTLTAATP